MKIHYDLHIHSILSPCGDILSTPNNILNMCYLKGLELISITDHNTLKQYQVIEKLKDSYDFLIIYGCEVTTREGFHVLTYFPDYNKAMEFDSLLETYFDKTIKSDFEQIICDEYDLESTRIDYYLHQNLIPFSKLIEEVHKLDGVVIPAHIDHKTTGILSYYRNLDDYNIDGIEIYNNQLDKPNEKIINKYSNYKVIFDSDAHSLELINEKTYSMELDELSFEGFKRWLNERT